MHRSNFIDARRTATGLVTLCLSLSACNESSESQGGSAGQVCVGAKCDNAEPVDDPEPSGEQENFDGLRDFSDPIAVWLVDNADDDGVVRADYLDMLIDVARLQGCGTDTIDSYVISDELVVEEGGAFPRIVNTVCSNDRTKADIAFFALSFPDDAGTDVDSRNVEMFAWDSKTRTYRFYKMQPIEGDSKAMQLEIEPAECAGCHGVPSNVDGSFMHMLPIMNELSAPWEHWSAAPVSVNHVVDAAILEAPNYKRIAGVDSPFLKSAARLENTIRAGFSQRVAIARLRTRRAKPADPAVAMSLLRPLFCDEQITYQTEDGASGIIGSSAAVDSGFHSAYFAFQGVGWPWEWWNDRIMRLAPPGAPDAVNMMPVRGEAMIVYEKQLMASRGLKPLQVLQVRALDWGNPAMSKFRCDLWHTAAERVKANPPEVTATTRNSHLLKGLLAEILTIVPKDHGLTGELPDRIAIVPRADDNVVSLKFADDSLQELAETLAASAIDVAECNADGEGVCELDARALGETLETHFKSIELGGRDALNAERNRRGCLARRFYANQPFIPDLPSEDECSALVGFELDPEPDPTGGESTGEQPTGGESTAGSTSEASGASSTGEAESEVAGNCCEARAEPGCDNAVVQACVCDNDDFCCESEWDQVCVNEVASFGCQPACES